MIGLRILYIEFVLSSPSGENLSDEKWLEVSKDYLQKWDMKNLLHNNKA